MIGPALPPPESNMKLLRPQIASTKRRGAALLLSILVLFVLIAIVAQISITTMTDARVGRNDVGQTLITHAIHSAQYDIYELLKSDGETGDEGGGGDPMAGAAGAAGGEEGGEEPEQPADSRKDEWAMRQRTEINGIQLVIQVEAENSKYNVLNMLNSDEEEAEEAFQRCVRIIDLYREDTEEDIPRREAEEMVREMKEYMDDRRVSGFAEPTLLTFDEDNDSRFLPMSLRDFLLLESWQPRYLRSYRDRNDKRVHSLDQFLTVWSSPGTLEEFQTGESSGSAAPDGAAGAAGTADGTTSSTSSSGPDGESRSTTWTASGQGNSSSGDDTGGLFPGGGASSNDSSGSTGGAASASSSGGEGGASGGVSRGYGVNVNLAPAAVLHGLFDDRDIRGRFWDDVIEYRNLEEEDEDSGADADAEPIYDEFGEQIIERQAFESDTELEEVRGWDDLDPEMQTRVAELLETESEVFTIYITGRRNTSAEDQYDSATTPEERARAEEEPSGALVRTVRIVVWRRTTDDGVEIVPIIPWEELDFTPFEIEDYPDDY